MMDFTSKQIFDSTTVPGARYTLRKMTAGNRVRLNLSLAPVTAKLAELGKRLQSIQVQLPDVPVDPDQRTSADGQQLEACKDTLAAFYGVMQQINDCIANERNPILFKWGLLKVEGIKIDGKVPTTEEVFEGGPEELAYEILAKINEAAGLSVEESKNFESPSTSGALEGSTTPSATNAANAGAPEPT